MVHYLLSVIFMTSPGLSLDIQLLGANDLTRKRLSANSCSFSPGSEYNSASSALINLYHEVMQTVFLAPCFIFFNHCCFSSAKSKHTTKAVFP